MQDPAHAARHVLLPLRNALSHNSAVRAHTDTSDTRRPGIQTDKNLLAVTHATFSISTGSLPVKLRRAGILFPAFPHVLPCTRS